MAKMKIKVLGPGCANCKKLLENTEAAVEELGVEAAVEYLTSIDEIKKYVMLTPGLVINEKVVHQGKPLLNQTKICSIIKKNLSKEWS